MIVKIPEEPPLQEDPHGRKAILLRLTEAMIDQFEINCCPHLPYESVGAVDALEKYLRALRNMPERAFYEK